MSVAMAKNRTEQCKPFRTPLKATSYLKLPTLIPKLQTLKPHLHFAEVAAANLPADLTHGSGRATPARGRFPPADDPTPSCIFLPRNECEPHSDRTAFAVICRSCADRVRIVCPSCGLCGRVGVRRESSGQQSNDVYGFAIES